MTRRMITGMSRVAGIMLALVLCFASAPELAAQTTLTPDVREALDRFTRGHNYTSQAERARDQAKLFANNDAINAARLNNEIPDSAYQAAQSDFDKLNTKFGQRAAQSAGADFTVQQRPPGSSFSPGTDFDYITVVKDKNQIGQMQSDYNRQVNEFLTKNGAIDKPRNNWQNKLDTDFMADPRHVSETDFRDIAKMNNDAYKRRASAEFERISRTKGGGKIGPEHVTSYTDDMADFTAKKRDNISEMFKNPSNFNDPANRAKAIQMMAQEQKYISRMEALDDYLRKQEGLPPRNRGVTTAKQGSIRDPSNIKGIKDARKVAKTSQGQAIADLTETMGEVAKKNPDFAKTSADDIAKIISRAPAEHRAAAMARLSRTNPDLAKAVKGSPRFGAVDDLAGGGRVRGAGTAGGRAKGPKLPRGIAATIDALDKVGRIAEGVEAAAALARIKEMIEAINKARDPNTTDAEAADLFDTAERIANDLAESSILVAIMERHPVVAAIFGTWTIGCAGGEWVASNGETGETIRRPDETCLDRQISAWDNLWDTYTGKKAEEDAQSEALCEKFKTAVREGRVKVKDHFDIQDVCWAIARRDPISDMIERGPQRQAGLPSGRCERAGKDLESARALLRLGKLGGSENIVNAIDTDGCPDVGTRVAGTRGEIAAAVDGLIAEAGGGLSCDRGNLDALSTRIASAQHPRLSEAAATTGRAARGVGQAAQGVERAGAAYAGGDLASARSALTGAQAALDSLGGAPNCPSLRERITSGLDRITRLEEATGKIDAAIAACDIGQIAAYDTQLQASGASHQMLAARAAILAKATPALSLAQNQFDRANKVYKSGSVTLAESELKAARDNIRKLNGEPECEGLVKRITAGLGKIAKLREARARARGAARSCDMAAIDKWLARFEANPTHRWIRNVSIELRDAKGNCRKRDVERDRSPSPDAKVSNKANCRKKYGGGYYAGPSDKDGNYFCLPTRRTANAWCRENNSGSGWKAGKIRRDGTYACNRTKAGRNSYCRRKFGRGYYAGRVRNGQFSCIPNQRTADRWCNSNNAGGGWRARNIRGDGAFDCYRPVARKPAPRHNSQSSAAIGAAGAAIIKGIIGATRKRDRSGGRRRTTRPRPVRPRARRTPSRTRRTPPPPSCPRGCRPVGYRLINGQWLGGHCACSKLN